jgi:hypothetical protein
VSEENAMRPIIAVLAVTLVTAACGGGSSPTDDPATGGGDAGVADEWDQKLAEREVDYNAALRIAALRLTGQLPTLAEIKAVADAGSPAAQKTVYESFIHAYLASPAFAGQMVRFWRDQLKMGESALLDTAPVFAAQITVEDRPFRELFTAATGTCPTFTGGAFTTASCQNGVTTHAGVLTNPGVQAQFFSNLAFRRVRWVQETFACTAFPAENSGDGAARYTSPWPFESIAGTDNGGTIDFHDQSAVVCANCHSTMNHLAPLFANFDDQGTWKTTIQVKTPTAGTPAALPTDWLPAGEATAWRYGTPVADLPALGAALAADPRVSECAVARLWNWALGKGDIVDTLSVVPADVISAQTAALQTSGSLRDAIFAVYTSADFVTF